MMDKDPLIKLQVGTNNKIIAWTNNEVMPNQPVVMRGTQCPTVIEFCKKYSIDYYIIDNAYIGNTKKKQHYRLVKNNNQYIGPIINRPNDRLLKLNLDKNIPYSRSHGNSILVVAPSIQSAKFMRVDLQCWIDNTISEIKKYSSRDIVVRLKPNRKERVFNNSFHDALRGMHCVVTYNSIAAVEALMYGKPVFTLAESCVNDLSNHQLRKIDNPYMPNKFYVYLLMRHLSYLQYTLDELQSGFAWKIIQETYNNAK